MKLLREVQQDAQTAITGDTFHLLLSKCYKIRYSWVNTTSVGAITKVLRKNLYLIQISEAELCGQYYKAWIVFMPYFFNFNNYLFKFIIAELISFSIVAPVTACYTVSHYVFQICFLQAFH